MKARHFQRVPYVGHLLRRFSSRGLLATVVGGCLVLGAACAEPGGGSSRRLSLSTGEFNQGFKIGKRDAKWSLTDTHAGGLWLWMMSNEYTQGYEQGWRAGRGEARLREQQNKQQTQP